MLRSCRLLCFLLSLSQALTAAEWEPPVAASPVLEDRYPRAEVAFPSSVQSLPDLIFSRPPGFRPLRLDLYRPKVAAKNGHPLVVYIHGGGWQSGHTRHSGAFADWPGVLAALAAKGFVVVSIEYRLSEEAPFPAAIHDVKTAIRWLRANAKAFGIDRSRALAWGGSAGGQLAALAAMSCNDTRLKPTFGADESLLAPESDCVQGVVAWYAVLDFASLPEFAGSAQSTQSVASAASKYLQCGASSCGERLALASPLAHVKRSSPPTLLIHGDRDAVVPVTQSREFHAALLSQKVPSDLMVIEGVDHSFIGTTPDATRKASLDALAKTFAFIEATIGGSRP